MAHVTEPAGARRRTHRPTVRGRRYVVAAGHALACVAAQRMLETGGNAIDAGVAAGIANNVLQPDIAHFGGIAPIIVYRAATRTVHTVQGVGRWPAAASGPFARRCSCPSCWRWPYPHPPAPCDPVDRRG